MTSFSTGSPSSTTSTSGVASYAQPYAQQNLANIYGLTQQAYQPYQGQQNAAMTGLQNQSFAAGQNLGVNQNSINAGNAAQTSINNLQNTSYNPNSLSQYGNINAPSLNNYSMNAAYGQAANTDAAYGQAAQTGASPYMSASQFNGPQNVGYQGVGTQGFDNSSAAQLMNPYLQQSLAPQLALLNQQQGMQATQNASQATQAGAFGGSRFGIQNALQNQSNQLATSNLVGNAYNTAYNNAQNQFNTQQALGLQAQQSNQQAGVTTGLANQNMAYNTGLQNAQLQQQAGLANQSLAGQYGLQNASMQQQTNMANTANQQQANLANQAAQNQFGLSNQAAQNTANQQNLASQLSTQQLGAQQNLTAQQANQANQLQANAQNINQQQFGAGLNLQANQSALQGASALNNIGNTQFSQGAQAASLQNQLGTQQQAYQQGLLNTQYQNFQNQLNYPYQQASYLQNAINGYPVSNTTSTTQPSTPSYLQQIGAIGAGLYGANTLTNGAVGNGITSAWNTLTGGKKGGLPKDFEVTKMKAGGSTQSSYIKKAISDAESLGDYDIANYLSSVLSGEVDTTNLSTVANSISTKVPQSVAGAQVAASPSAGQQAAGITPANPNLQAPSGLGTQPQQTQRGIAPAAPSAAESSSNPYSMPTMQDLIAMKNAANTPNATAQQVTQNPNGIANYFKQDKTPEQINSQSEADTMGSANGGLQHVPISNRMIPSEYANGGITDVARFDEGGSAEEKKAAVLAELYNKGLMSSQAAQPAPSPAPSPTPSPAPSPAPAPTPMQQPNIPQNAGGDNTLDMGSLAATNQALQGQGQAPTTQQRVAPPMQSQQAQQTQGYSMPAIPANANDEQIRNIAGKAAYNILAQTYEDAKSRKPMSSEEQIANQKAIRATLQREMGESPYIGLIAENEKNKQTNIELERMQKGIAAIAAMPDFLEGNQASRGLAKGISSVAKGYGQAMISKAQADQHLDAANQNLKLAQRAEEYGLTNMSSKMNKEVIESILKHNENINKANTDIANALGRDAQDMKGFRPNININDRPSSARNYQDDVEAIKATLKETDKAAGTTHPETWYESEARTKARGLVSTGMPGNAATNQTGITKEQEAIKAKDIADAKKMFMSPMFQRGETTKATFKKYMQENGNDLVKAQAAYAIAVANGTVSSNSSNTGTSSSPNVTTTVPNPLNTETSPTISGAPKGTTLGPFDSTVGKYKVLDETGKQIGWAK